MAWCGLRLYRYSRYYDGVCHDISTVPGMLMHLVGIVVGARDDVSS